eukprot:3282444-Pyramimonas_sp.AAC.1
MHARTLYPIQGVHACPVIWPGVRPCHGMARGRVTRHRAPSPPVWVFVHVALHVFETGVLPQAS